MILLITEWLSTDNGDQANILSSTKVSVPVLQTSASQPLLILSVTLWWVPLWPLQLQNVSHVIHHWWDSSVDESRIAQSGSVWNHQLPADKAIWLLHSQDGYIQGSYECNHSQFCGSLTCLLPDSLQKHSLLGHHKPRWGNKCDHEQWLTTETGWGRGPWFYQRVVENHWMLLACWSEGTARCKGYAIPAELCCMDLEQKAVDLTVSQGQTCGDDINMYTKPKLPNPKPWSVQRDWASLVLWWPLMFSISDTPAWEGTQQMLMDTIVWALVFLEVMGCCIPVHD